MLEEITEAALKGLPKKQSASTRQTLAIIALGTVVFVAGWYASHGVQTYFDQWHKELLASNGQLLAAVQDLGKTQEQKNAAFAATDQALGDRMEKTETTVEAVRTYYWKNSDMQQWANQLDHLNRQSVPAMIVPTVPQPSPAH